MPEKNNSFDLKFPHKAHADCRALTQITLENLPPDNSFSAVRRFSRTAAVWQFGDRADRLYFLERGRIRITSLDRDGREVVLAIIVAGEPFGELCFCGGPTERRRTTAKASADSLVVEITIDDFIAYMQQSGEILGRFIFTFCIRLAHAERRIAILALHGAEERLGSVLLHLAETRGVSINSERPDEVKLAITHDELAGLTAMSRQRVTITMNQFRQLGLVRYNRTQPLVIDIVGLTKYLEQAQR